MSCVYMGHMCVHWLCIHTWAICVCMGCVYVGCVCTRGVCICTQAVCTWVVCVHWLHVHGPCVYVCMYVDRVCTWALCMQGCVLGPWAACMYVGHRCVCVCIWVCVHIGRVSVCMWAVCACVHWAVGVCVHMGRVSVYTWAVCACVHMGRVSVCTGLCVCVHPMHLPVLAWGLQKSAQWGGVAGLVGGSAWGRAPPNLGTLGTALWEPQHPQVSAAGISQPPGNVGGSGLEDGVTGHGHPAPSSPSCLRGTPGSPGPPRSLAGTLQGRERGGLPRATPGALSLGVCAARRVPRQLLHVPCAGHPG